MSEIKLCSDIIGKEDIDYLIDWLKDVPQLTKGKKTIEFEEKFSKYLGCKHSIYCNSGSSANLLMVSALHQMGRMKNTKVVVPQVSWSTTIFPVMQLGLEPIMCDCSLWDLGINTDHFKRIVREQNPAAIILVHVLGLDSNIQEIRAICKEHDILIMEDTCESLGSEVNGKKLGTFGDCSSFSFYFGHHISTIEGGMVCTDDDNIADVVRMIRSHGWDRDLSESSRKLLREEYDVSSFDALYKFYYAGFNLRSTDLQAYLGLRQIDKLDWVVEAREKNYMAYKKFLSKNLWKPIESPDQNVVSNMGYPLIVENREKIQRVLTENGVESRPLVSGSMGTQPAWVDAYGESRMVNADIIQSKGMYVPNHPEMTIEDVKKVCSIVNGIES